MQYLADGVLSSLRRQVWVQAGDGVLEAFLEDDFVVTFALRVASVGADVFFALGGVTECAELIQQCLLYFGFG